MRKLLLAFAGLGFLIAALGAAGWWTYERPGPSDQPLAVIIPKGGTGRTLAVLQRAGILRTSWQDRLTFEAAALLTRHDGALHSAELLFEPYGSMADVLSVLRHGRPVQHRLTIPEGLTAWQIMALIDHAPILSGATPPIAEGTILPQTYEYQWGTTRADFVGRLLSHMRDTVATIWRTRDPGSVLTDAHAFLVLASIVERETGRQDERPQVASVFLNRLRQGMRLQSDPTVIYDLSEGRRDLGHPLTHEDLAEPGAYNTYMIAALPPGPICSPGEAALDAVAHPAESKALYFVADGRGGPSIFADNLADHNRHVAALRAIAGATH